MLQGQRCEAAAVRLVWAVEGSTWDYSTSYSGRKNPRPAPKKGLKAHQCGERFELSGRTGQGSMSKVFRAYDKDLGRNVCLKILDKAKTQSFEGRFQGLKKPSEGEICMSLRHDNIVRSYEHGVTVKGEPYLIMEWVEGLGLNYLVETLRNAAHGQSHQLPESTLRCRPILARQQMAPSRPLHA